MDVAAVSGTPLRGIVGHHKNAGTWLKGYGEADPPLAARLQLRLNRNLWPTLVRLNGAGMELSWRIDLCRGSKVAALQYCGDIQTTVLLIACLGNSRDTRAGAGGYHHHSIGRMAVRANPEGAQAVAGAQQQ